MGFKDPNACKNWNRYLPRHLQSLCRQVPPERRESLAQELADKASILGCKQPEVLKAALKVLIPKPTKKPK